MSVHPTALAAPGPIARIRKLLKKHIDSTNFFWWSAIEIANWAAHWLGYAELPFYLWINRSDRKKMTQFRTNVQKGTVVLAFCMSREHFYSMYRPIIKKLPTSYRICYIVPDSSLSTIRSHLRKEGVHDDDIICSSWSLFIHFDAYVSCWFSTYHPNVLNWKNANSFVEIYHGVGTALFDKSNTNHSSQLFRAELKKFTIHFATGPATKSAVESLGRAAGLREIGYPKTDILFGNQEIPATIREECTFPNDLPLVVYSPHHHESGSLATHGIESIIKILSTDVNVIVKLHGLLSAKDVPMHECYEMIRILAMDQPRLRVVCGPTDPTFYYMMADIVVGDIGSNSTGFEAILCKKPVVLLWNQEWLNKQDKRMPEFRIFSLCDTVESLDDLPITLMQALATTDEAKREQRFIEVSQMLYNPGNASEAAASELITIVEHSPAP